MSIKRVAITGAAGQIAYNLLFQIARGQLYGLDQPIALHLLDIEENMRALEAIAMELEDCALNLVKQVSISSECKQAFEGVDFAFLIGAKPRRAGMERKDLLEQNAHIFIEQGKALTARACSQVRVLVIGNPCNTNAWILSKSAPDLRVDHIHAMTRLDQNRARAMLAKKSGVDIDDVSPVIIWGNHSSTQVPDFFHTTIKGRPAGAMLDAKWLQEGFIQDVQQRGDAILAIRGKSSAASAAHAAVDAAYDITHPTLDARAFSSAVYSAHNGYGIDEDLFFSFPCKTDKDLKVDIVRGFTWGQFIRQKIEQTEKELIIEREQVRQLLVGST